MFILLLVVVMCAGFITALATPSGDDDTSNPGPPADVDTWQGDDDDDEFEQSFEAEPIPPEAEDDFEAEDELPDFDFPLDEDDFYEAEPFDDGYDAYSVGDDADSPNNSYLLVICAILFVLIIAVIVVGAIFAKYAPNKK